MAEEPQQPVQLQILSDLHLEAPAAYDIFTITPTAPYLALLGDIGYVKDEGFFEFLRKQLANFQIVFLVLGNHEPYGSSWCEAKSAVRKFEQDMDTLFQRGEVKGKFVFLDQTRYDISSTVTVLGCTLFSNVIPEETERVSFGLNDFYRIKDDWSVEKHVEAHLSHLAWLNTQVDSISREEPDRKVIILTHYCPCTHEKVVDPKHATNSKISSGFMSDLSGQVCWGDSSRIVKVWAFGHTHFNCDFEGQETGTGKRVVSNQRGYYFAQSEGFDGEKVVEV